MDKRISGRTCSICKEKIFNGILGMEEHGREEHPNFFLQTGGNRMTFAEKVYFCPPANKWFSNLKYLSRELTKLEVTNEEYFNAFGEEWMPREWKRSIDDPVLGDARNNDTCLECKAIVPFDSGHWCYNAFCGFSCSTSWYAKNTDRVARSRQTIAIKEKNDPNFGLRPSQLQYWINKGFSKDEAKCKVSERQATGSLENFIKRAGGDVEVGTQKHTDRQEKWLTSMHDSGLHSGYSQASTILFDAIQEMVPNEGLFYGKTERSIRLESSVIKVDCLKESQKKIIEFYGDYWHGNPRKFKETDTIKYKRTMLVSEKWDYDRKRIQDLRNLGYEVLIIWEMDYNENKEEAINLCVEFLNRS